MSQSDNGNVRLEDYVKGELSKDTNWWGAFVVGLAGTILVTGVTPAVLAPLGAAAIPNFIFWTLTGWLLCLYLAELAAMLPDRTGGAPAYAAYAFRTATRRPTRTSTASRCGCTGSGGCRSWR